MTECCLMCDSHLDSEVRRQYHFHLADYMTETQGHHILCWCHSCLLSCWGRPQEPSLAPAQHQQESPLWGTTQKETSLSANSSVLTQLQQHSINQGNSVFRADRT